MTTRAGDVPALAARVEEILAVDPATFQDRAEIDAETVKTELRDGTFDNHQSIVGLEYEFYAVSQGRWNAGDETEGMGRGELARVPRRLLDLIGFEKELGLHNAEMTTSPQPFNPDGLRAQSAEVRSRLRAALETTSQEGMRLVSDAMWTTPPAGESARSYLSGAVESEGVLIGTNMSDSPRYHAMGNGPAAGDEFRIDAPFVDFACRTAMPVALTTSIQPHYQVPTASDLPRYHDYAIRLAGPLLALGVNSPFFPPELYADDADPDAILAEGHDENRVATFECLNVTGAPKVCLPQDLHTVEEAVDRVAADDVIVPMPEDAIVAGDRFDDTFATLRRKHGTYWRWVRPVFGGDSRSAANARLEFRPIPGQPTVRDSVAFVAAFAGLMECLPQRRHPSRRLDWGTAHDNFRAAAAEGLDADLQWVTNDGVETTDIERVFEDIFAHAEAGLVGAGCSEREAEGYLAPLRHRVETGTTPASWKRDRAREHRADGMAFPDAVRRAQRDYLTRQRETLLDGAFADW
ncbi:hypothetical protein RYH80_04375 [Halobaculum sp. MBLA0147]|uniref:hypothetical protein n=1 Tax=Halobaculum sp. MBLA0147 TaxID=3079934 RepID=UPI00352616EC